MASQMLFTHDAKPRRELCSSVSLALALPTMFATEHFCLVAVSCRLTRYPKAGGAAHGGPLRPIGS
jgi:hypothetical protein